MTISFNPRIHEGCDSIWIRFLLPHNGFQSTHPRRMRPQRCRCSRLIYTVSIHASTKDATHSLHLRLSLSTVSIHASTKDATFLQTVLTFPSVCFNPRIHEGCDVFVLQLGIQHNMFQSTHPRRMRRQVLQYLKRADDVSIHASTKDATEMDIEEIQQRLVSIHASTKDATYEIIFVT